MTEINKNYDHQFIKIYKKVKSLKNLNYLQRLILSEIISYQMQGLCFFVKNDSLAMEYGCSSQTIQNNISDLYKQKLLYKYHFYPKNPNGGRNPRRRALLVDNLLELVPAEIVMNIKIDVSKLKSLRYFMTWCNYTFKDVDLMEQFINARPEIEKRFGKIF